MHRTDRRNAIIEELRRAGPAGRTASSLAARSGVSVRTIRRDLVAIEQEGVPVAATTGPGGGYVLADPTTLPTIALTAPEATAVAVALATLADGSLRQPALSAFEKVLDVLDPTAQRQVAELAASTTAHPGGFPRTAVTRTIEDALRTHEVVALDYEDAAGRRTVGRRVEPALIAFANGHWYLLAWCLERRGPRWFRWDRIDHAVATGDPAGDRDGLMTFGTPPPGARPRRRA